MSSGTAGMPARCTSGPAHRAPCPWPSRAGPPTLSARAEPALGRPPHPAGPGAAPAAPGRYLMPLEAARVPPLEHLGIGEPGVSHVGLHHVGAVEAVPGT